MPQATMQEDRFAPSATLAPEAAADFTPPPPEQLYFSALSVLGAPGHLGTPREVEKELDVIAMAIRLFHAKPADMVMRECSGYTARLTEMVVLLHRVENGNRTWAKLRTMQVQKFLDEMDRQWKTASRLIEVQRQDIVVMRGLT